MVGLGCDASKKFESRRRGDLLVVLRHSYRRWDSTFKGRMYAKVFSQIFDSSIADDYELRHFFMDLLVLADVNGVVDMTPSAIAARTRMPIKSVEKHLKALEAPDPESRTPKEEGRRIIRLDEHRTWGWAIVNYEQFRKISNEFQRREKTRERVRRFRESHVTLCNASVTGGNGGNAVPYPSASACTSKDRGVGEGVRRLSGAERIGLERELAFNRTTLNLLAKDDFPDAGQRAEKKRLKERNKAIEKALHIPL